MKTTAMTLLVLALGLTVSTAGAQQLAPPAGATAASNATVLRVEAEFAGFDGVGQALFQARIWTAPFDSGSADRDNPMLLVLRGSGPPPFNPLAPGAFAEHRGRIDSSTSSSYLLAVPNYFQGPIFLDVWLSRRGPVARTVGPMQLPRPGTGITTYGEVTARSDQLHLHAVGMAGLGATITFAANRPQGMELAFLGLSPYRTRMELAGQTLLIGPAPIGLIPMQAGENGFFFLQMQVPSDPALNGVRMHAQALAIGTVGDSVESATFSNGVQLDLASLIT